MLRHHRMSEPGASLLGARHVRLSFQGASPVSGVAERRPDRTLKTSTRARIRAPPDPERVSERPPAEWRREESIESSSIRFDDMQTSERVSVQER